jgi:myo-inositol-1(or 4)-monophosphatase
MTHHMEGRPPMTPDAIVPPLARKVADTVRQVMAEIRPELVHAALTGDRGESDNLRHADNFLSVHDLRMHRRYQELLTGYLDSYVYASEEADPVVIGPDADPDLCVLVDPLDTSELAVRGLCGYTHVMVYSRSLARPVVAVVGDIYHHIQLYLAARDDAGTDHAYVITADGATTRLSPPAPKQLHQSLVTNYLMRPSERFTPLAARHDLLAALAQPGPDGKARGRIGVDFGSVGLCHVAAGFTDAMVEFAKGFAIWDLAPGQYILHSAGGVVLDLHGQPLSLDCGFTSLDDIAQAMSGRQAFVAASTAELAHDLVKALQ